MKHIRRLFAALLSSHNFPAVLRLSTAISLSFVLLIFITGGCGLNKSPQAQTDQNATISKPADEKSSDKSKTSDDKSKSESSIEKEGKDMSEGTEKAKATIYFADQTAEYLRPEQRMIKDGSVQEMAKSIVEELILGPKNSDHTAIIPKDTRLLSVKVVDTEVIVDFSAEFIKNHPGGSAGETMTIYGLVDSLTELPGIKGVRIIVDHQEVESLAGHYDLKGTITRDESIIKADQ